MRMWLVDPKKMCRQHLLGEHVEMHMFAGCIRKGISINGYLEKGLVETAKIKPRHDLLAREMRSRGMHHRSPLKQPRAKRLGKVDVAKSRKDLRARCAECRKLLR